MSLRLVEPPRVTSRTTRAEGIWVYSFNRRFGYQSPGKIDLPLPSPDSPDGEALSVRLCTLGKPAQELVGRISDLLHAQIAAILPWSHGFYLYPKRHANRDQVESVLLAELREYFSYDHLSFQRLGEMDTYTLPLGLRSS